MKVRTSRRSLWLVALVALCGCADPPAEDVDAGAMADVGPSSSDASIDGSVAPDGSVARDGGSSFDAGSSFDGAAPSDGAMALDGGVTPLDASGADAGRAEAGLADGGARTTCSITSSPSVGSEGEDFTFVALSNGSMCEAQIDGGATLSVPCSAMMMFGGALFGVGMHTIELRVLAGPSGPASCTTRFTVTAPAADGGVDGGAGDAGSATTSCAIAVTPERGSASATFTADFSSNGSDCELSVDTFSLGTVPCVGTYSGPGSAVGVGTHTATLRVILGPSGSRSCSATFVVE